MGLKPVVYEADRIGGRLRTEASRAARADRRDGRDALPAVLDGAAALHRPGRPGDRPLPQPARRRPRRPRSSTSRARRTTPRPLDDLPQVFRDVANAWNEALEEGADFSDMQQAMRERDVAPIKAIWDPLVRLDDETFYGFLAALRGLQARPSGTARSSARSASAPAAGTPTSPTPSWRSCASSTPRPTTTTAASSAASSSCRCGCGGGARAGSCTGRAGTSLASLHGGVPRPARHADRAHRRRPDRRHRPLGRHPHLPGGVFTCQTWMLLDQIDCDERCSPSTTGRRWSAPTTWRLQALRARRPAVLEAPTRRPAATSCA